jgi:hypothetical protein
MTTVPCYLLVHDVRAFSQPDEHLVACKLHDNNLLLMTGSFRLLTHTCSFYDRSLLDALCVHAIARISTFQRNTLISVMYACAYLNHKTESTEALYKLWAKVPECNCAEIL